MNELIGTTFAHYRVLERIGAGGMGVVYRARDEHLERDVALKVLPSSAIAGEDARKRFRREALALSRLSHPNVATVHDFDTRDGIDFLVMEHIPGETLDAIIRRGPLPAPEVIRLGAQIAQGLSAAHEQGILHGDLKPGNLRVTPSGLLKVLDFGLARWLRAPGTAATTATGSVTRSMEGTLPYMAPEQIRGIDIDFRADLYALGVVLYEMATGKPPFQGSDAIRLLHAILDSEPVPPRSILSTIPAELEAICMKAMARDREHRYPGAREIIEALGVSSAGWAEPLRVTPPPSPPLPLDAAGSLPAPISSFIGREAEIASAADLLSRTRLLTLTGPGGTGKTRTGLEIASRSRKCFRDGAAFIPLAAIREPPLVSCAFAQALGIHEVGGQHITETMKARLRSKELLLLIDNFEQVISAAPLVSELLEACPGMKAIVTSRSPLRVRGESELPIPPLDVPGESPTEDPSSNESVRLFVERASAARPSFRLTPENVKDVARICERLEGLPLAIELAAAWIKLLPPSKILEKLESRLELLTGGARDLPARQRSMRAAIAWSHDLLEDSDRKSWRILSVFRGGCTLASAQAVLGASAPGDEAGADALGRIASLVDKSILIESPGPDGEPRFRMLEMIREFGLERLSESGEEAGARDAHLEFFRAFATAAEAELAGKDQVAWLARVDAEHDNLRAALEWSLAAGAARTERGLELVGALWYFWLVRGRLSEGRERLRRMLAAPPRDPTTARARALFGEGTLAHNLGHYEAARSLYEESLVIGRSLGDESSIAAALHRLGWVVQLLGDLEAGRRKSEESLALFRKLGDRRGAVYPLRNLGWIANLQGDYSTSVRCYEEVLSIVREAGDQRSLCFGLSSLAWARINQGRYDLAMTLLDEAFVANQAVRDAQIEAFSEDLKALVLHLNGDHRRALELLESAVSRFRHLEDRFGLAFTLSVLGSVLLRLGEMARAKAAHEEGLALRKTMLNRWGIAVSLHGLGEIAEAEGDSEKAAGLFAKSLELHAELEDRRGAAECLERIAGLVMGRGKEQDGAELIGAASRIREEIGSPVPPCDREADARRLEDLARALGSGESRAGMERGRGLGRRTAAARAIELVRELFRGKPSS